MADITVTTSAATASRNFRNVVFTTPTTGYIFYFNAFSDLSWRKTTNGGLTWSTETVLNTETMMGLDVWYDQWTPGDTGKNIHIWYFGTTADDIFYRRMDTNTDLLSSEVTVFSGTSAASARGIFVSGAKMRGGNLYCAFDIDAGAEMGTYRSVDNGATWVARTNVIEATLDQCTLYPGNEADPNDVWILYHDADADSLTLKVHDDSANSNSESTSILTLVEDGTDFTGQYGFAGSIRHSDGHLILAAFSEFDAVTTDFRIFDINGASSITELTAIATDKDNIYYPNVFIENRTNTIYVVYTGKSDASEAIGVTVNIYYAKSTDGGLTWSKDNLYNVTGGNLRQSFVPQSGVKFIIVWRDDATETLITNTDNSKDFGAVNFNNFQFVSVKGFTNVGNTLSVTEKIR